ncbi:MAG: putative tryptophan--tRNA ligase [Harvfovirus sp.]|uniref:tryptophan--tRNA ligase n=1 Tax=Harvfovirus sp. TaxID=2487768 RepID=A0A3G5A0E3_9VIRU|nr:MAG: putative tryptophan--tRNA ligase [Harvfovirus sp.]
MLHSFLPSEPPVLRLPEYYACWENLVDRLPELNATESSGKEISSLPLLSLTPLTIPQTRRAYVVLSMITHSYIWGNSLATCSLLPKNIAIPFYTICKSLGLPPVITHSAVDLWNWKLIDPSAPPIVENIELISSFTGTESETTFHAVMTEIEAIGSEIIPHLSKIPTLIAEKNTTSLLEILSLFPLTMNKITLTLSKMYLTCSPEIFYNTLRKFLKGWGYDPKIPDGLTFEGVPEAPTPIKCHGGSAGQSSLIRLFDIIFNIKHSPSSNTYLQDMLNYMPETHRNFLNIISSQLITSPLDIHITNTKDTLLTKAYNNCIESLTLFRNKHMALVHTYVIKIDKKTKGTGDTALKSFLKSCETATAKKKLNPESVTPFNVEGDIDYVKLTKQFGTELIDFPLLERFQQVTGTPPHPWLLRGKFFSHRELNRILDAHEKGEPIALYTGRGPSSESLHLGHLIPFLFTKWLQDTFNCTLIIQIADDEKFYFKQLDFAEIYRLGQENSKDIIACGFNPKKTFIFSNRDYRLSEKSFEALVSQMKKLISAKQVAKIFGFGDKITVSNSDGTLTEHYVFNEETTVGMLDWPFYQSAAAFSESFPHLFQGKKALILVPYAIDQDAYFRLARDIAPKMNLPKPCSIISKFLPSLTGSSGKMSSSTSAETTLFLTDDPSIIRKKIMKYSFSGGGGNGSLADHKKFGGNITTDIAYQYLTYFEMDDARLNTIREGFTTGLITCTEMKTILADKIISLFTEHQTRRKTVTDEELHQFYQK